MVDFQGSNVWKARDPVAYPGFQHGGGRGTVGAEGVGCSPFPENFHIFG